MKARLLRLHRALLDRFGPRGWWPARTAFEIAVGAILVQHPATPNATQAILALRRARLLSPRALDRVSEARLGQVIRSARRYRSKARHLKAFTRWLVEQHGGRFDDLRRAPLASLRRDLLAVPGLGPETADAILLYAAHRPAFVADASARRALAGHGFLPATAGYEEARLFLEDHLPSDPALFNEFHTLLVAAGQRPARRGNRAEARVSLRTAHAVRRRRR